MTRLVNQPTAWPTRKLSSAVLVAAAASVGADIAIDQFMFLQNVETDQLELLIEAGLTAILVGIPTFVAGWFVKDKYNG